MEQRKPTPEEQLLKLIENPDAQKPAAPGASEKAEETQKKAPPKAPFRLPGLGIIAGSFSYFQAKLQKSGAHSAIGVKVRPAIDIKLFNRILIGILFISGIYLIVDMALFKPKSDFMSQVATADTLYPKLGEGAKAVSPENFYKDSVAKRNPFLPPGSGQPAAPAAGEPAAAPSAPEANPLAEILQNFKLVGISWGEEPLAMVEDTTTSRTYFLRRGQEVRGVKIQEIKKEKVVFSYEGKEGELF